MSSPKPGFVDHLTLPAGLVYPIVAPSYLMEKVESGEIVVVPARPTSAVIEKMKDDRRTPLKILTLVLIGALYRRFTLGELEGVRMVPVAQGAYDIYVRFRTSRNELKHLLCGPLLCLDGQAQRGTGSTVGEVMRHLDSLLKGEEKCPSYSYSSRPEDSKSGEHGELLTGYPLRLLKIGEDAYEAQLDSRFLPFRLDAQAGAPVIRGRYVSIPGGISALLAFGRRLLANAGQYADHSPQTAFALRLLLACNYPVQNEVFMPGFSCTGFPCAKTLRMEPERIGDISPRHCSPRRGKRLSHFLRAVDAVAAQLALAFRASGTHINLPQNFVVPYVENEEIQSLLPAERLLKVEVPGCRKSRQRKLKTTSQPPSSCEVATESDTLMLPKRIVGVECLEVWEEDREGVVQPGAQPIAEPQSKEKTPLGMAEIPPEPATPAPGVSSRLTRQILLAASFRGLVGMPSTQELCQKYFGSHEAKNGEATNASE